MMRKTTQLSLLMKHTLSKREIRKKCRVDTLNIETSGLKTIKSNLT